MPDVPKHAWTHRPRSEGGTDPIVFPESAGGFTPVGMMIAGETSRASGTKLYVPMDLFWTNDTSVFGYADVTSGAAKFMSIASPGVYRAVGWISWGPFSGTDFTAGDNPHFVFSTEFGGVDGDLVPGLNEYFDSSSSSVDAIWNRQLSGDELQMHGIGGEVIFNFSEDNWGESPIKIGVALYSDNSRTLPFSAQLAVYRISTELVEFVAIT